MVAIINRSMLIASLFMGGSLAERTSEDDKPVTTSKPRKYLRLDKKIEERRNIDAFQPKSNPKEIHDLAVWANNNIISNKNFN